MSDKVLVIGSNSFSGASFSAFALRQGASVIATSRSPEPSKVFLPYAWPQARARPKFHQLDLNTDLDSLTDLIKREKPRYVVNFAAQSMVGESWAQPEHWFQTNVVSTIKLHDRLRHFDFLDRYVHISTPEVYGSTQGAVSEGASFNPSTPYAVSRAAADMSLSSFFTAYEFPFIITRASNVYGAGQQLYRIIPRAILFILLRRKLELHGGGLSRRSFIHIDDVSEATWSAMTRGRAGESYHISTKELVSIRSLVEIICEVMNVRFDDSVAVVEDRLGKDTEYDLDSNKIRKELEWSDKISLEDGLEQCIRWVRENIEVLEKQPFDYIHKP